MAATTCIKTTAAFQVEPSFLYGRADGSGLRGTVASSWTAALSAPQRAYAAAAAEGGRAAAADCRRLFRRHRSPRRASRGSRRSAGFAARPCGRAHGGGGRLRETFPRRTRGRRRTAAQDAGTYRAVEHARLMGAPGHDGVRPTRGSRAIPAALRRPLPSRAGSQKSSPPWSRSLQSALTSMADAVEELCEPRQRGRVQLICVAAQRRHRLPRSVAGGFVESRS